MQLLLVGYEITKYWKVEKKTENYIKIFMLINIVVNWQNIRYTL